MTVLAIIGTLTLVSMGISYCRRFSLGNLFEDITENSNPNEESRGIIETLMSKHENEITTLITTRHPWLNAALRVLRQLDRDENESTTKSKYEWD